MRDQKGFPFDFTPPAKSEQHDAGYSERHPRPHGLIVHCLIFNDVSAPKRPAAPSAPGGFGRRPVDSRA